MPGTWTFQRKPPGQVKRDPFEDVFFIGEEEDEPGDPCPRRASGLTAGRPKGFMGCG